MIDKICTLEHGKSARGIKNITLNDAFLCEVFPGFPVFSPVIAAEAVAQLVSWIIIAERDFSVKPVITVVDSYRCSGHMQPGDRLEVVGTVESFSEESALAGGEILLNGRRILELTHAVCYLYPLHELDHPDQTRNRFADLYDEGHPLPRDEAVRSIPREHMPLVPRHPLDMIIGGDDPDRLHGIKNVTATEDYFNDHFPRKPVLPGVITMEAMTVLGAELLARTLAAAGRTDVRPVLHTSRKVKFRKFVQPGDRLNLQAQLADCSGSEGTVRIQAAVDGKNAAMITAAYDILTRDAYEQRFLQR